MNGIIRMVDVQYISDLHLEFQSFDLSTIPVCASILVLAGDIGDPSDKSYGEVLSHCASRWRHVVLVAGNHEFYSKDGMTLMDTKRTCIQHHCAKHTNVHFLHRSVVELETTPHGTLRIGGCTLWFCSQALSDEQWSMLGDFRHIRYARSEIWREHNEDVTFVRENADKVDLMVTHHVPTPDALHAQYKDHLLNSAFATSELWNRKMPPWICGHTHKAFVYNDKFFPLLVCNPLGYKNEETDVQLDKTLRVDSMKE
jgi:predicted phosphodiesterase